MLESQFGEVLQQRRLGKVEASQASWALLAMSPSSNAVRNAQRLAARTAAQRKALQQLRNTLARAVFLGPGGGGPSSGATEEGVGGGVVRSRAEGGSVFVG